MSEYIAKASIEPRDYRVVFLIQKGYGGKPSPYPVTFHICFFDTFPAAGIT